MRRPVQKFLHLPTHFALNKEHTALRISPFATKEIFHQLDDSSSLPRKFSSQDSMKKARVIVVFRRFELFLLFSKEIPWISRFYSFTPETRIRSFRFSGQNTQRNVT